MLAKGVERSHAAVDAAARLGNEQAVVGQRILAAPCGKSRVVDVGSKNVNRRSGGVPDVLETRNYNNTILQQIYFVQAIM